MWRGKEILKLLLVLFLLLVGLGSSSNGDHNGEEEGLLCKVLTAGEKILKNTDVVDEHHKKEFEKAIYGDEFRAKFDLAGRVSVGRHCHTKTLRTQHCKYYTPDQRYSWGGKDGCFAESLIGTFFCVCAPGDPKSNLSNLCGVSTSEYKGGWWSSYSWEKTTLLKHVWDRVIQKCTNASGNVVNILAELETLKKSVESLKEKIKRSGKNNNFYYLGGTGQAGCNANNVNEICSGYQGKGGEGLNIPWVNKIENTIHEIQKVEKEKDRLSQESAAVTSPREENQDADAALVERQDAAPILEGPIASINSEENREREPESQPTRNLSTLEEVPKKGMKKNTPNNSFIREIPHLALDPNEDGSVLNRPKWLLLVALLI